TERLLDIIRGKTDLPGIQQAPSPGRPTAVKVSKLTGQKTKTSSQSVTIGIDIGYKYLNLVKASGAPFKRKILEYKSISLPADIEQGSDEFNTFLKSKIVPYCR